LRESISDLHRRGKLSDDEEAMIQGQLIQDIDCLETIADCGHAQGIISNDILVRFGFLLFSNFSRRSVYNVRSIQ
jgi:hypothetical protein